MDGSPSKKGKRSCGSLREFHVQKHAASSPELHNPTVKTCRVPRFAAVFGFKAVPCFHPLDGFLHPAGGITFSRSVGYSDRPIQVPCRRCIGCRIDYSREWAVRCYHESQTAQRSCFITLTYNDSNLPQDNSLHHDHFQLFMKRLRKKYNGRVIRYLMSGEYGDQLGRPHFHACLFGLDFISEDRSSTVWNRRDLNGEEVLLWRSPILDKLWSVSGSPIGFCSVGAVTFASAAYVARYILKKVHGKSAPSHYQGRRPEYIQPSLGSGKKDPISGEALDGGIGFDWFQRFSEELWPDDFVVIENKKFRIPTYYMRLLERSDPVRYQEIKLRRAVSSAKKKPERTKERLAVREKVFKSRVNKLKRGHQDEN